MLDIRNHYLVCRKEYAKIETGETHSWNCVCRTIKTHERVRMRDPLVKK